MKNTLEQRLQTYQYGKKKGKTAIEEMHTYIVNNLLEPKTEEQIIIDSLTPQENFIELFDLYFHLYPDEAEKILKKEGNQTYGMQKVFFFFEKIIWSKSKKAQYASAKRNLQYQLE